jgi:hypothetical protein
MGAKYSNLRRISVNEYNIAQLKKFISEGRLFLDERVDVNTKTIKDDIRAYVARIRIFVTPKFRSSVDELWEQIFESRPLMEVLMPKPKARKCKAFDKYGVMRIVGVLREKGIYEQYSDPVFDAQFEEPGKDSPYRRFLSQGLEQRGQLVALRGVVERYLNFNFLVN